MVDVLKEFQGSLGLYSSRRILAQAHHSRDLLCGWILSESLTKEAVGLCNIGIAHEGTLVNTTGSSWRYRKLKRTFASHIMPIDLNLASTVSQVRLAWLEGAH